MAKEIPLFGKLGDGKFTVVDDDVYEELVPYKWRLSNCGYAVSTINGKLVRMHRLIMDAKEGIQVDHINQDKLDNRKGNLRLCTHQQNNMNKGKKSNNTSGFKGVFRHSDIKWSAHVRHNDKSYYLGIYKTAEDAAMAYDKKAKELFGEFASLNFSYNGDEAPPKRIVGRGKSKYRGVWYSQANGKYIATICKNKQPMHLGSFENEDDAARMYNFWAMDIFGKSAVLNKLY